MRNLKSYIASLLFVAIGLTGCQDDFDNPVLQGPEATIGANTSILDLKTAYWNKTDSNYIDNIDDNFKNYIATIGTKENGEHIVIAGRVISSDRSGNIYKNLVIQDETGALTLSINQSGLYNNYRIGQEVVIDVTNMHIGKYNGLQQLGWPDYSEEYGWQATFMPFAFFTQHTQLNGLPEPEKVDTLLMSLENLSSADLIKSQSQLVRFNNVRFANEDGEFADGSMAYTDGSEINSNRALYDENGNTIVVRNSGYASFWSDKLPVGYGDVVGILSYYGTSGWQLLLRSTDDCMNFGNPTIAPGTESNPYTVEQAIALEEAGETPSGWVTGYIVGAVAPEVTTITTNDDIEWTAPFTLANTLVIAPAADVNDITKCLVISLPQDSKLREYANLKDNADNLRNQIWLLGKLEKFMDTYGITGNRGTVSEFKLEGLEVPGGEIPAGDGTENSPYNATQILGGMSGSGVWGAGYIVGWIDGKSITDGAKFSIPATIATNVLIANTPNETDLSKCVPVQLPAGDLRAAVNLVDNPGNFGKKLYYQGNLTAYFGVNGLKEGTAYKLEGEGGGSDTPETPAEPVTSLNETFEGITSASQLKGWTSKIVAGDKAWYFTTFDNNSYAACTAYKGKDDSNGYDSWLITPPLNVNGMTSKTLSFDSQAAYSGGAFEVYAMTTNDPATATLTKLDCTLATPPASGYSGFVPSGEISLSQFSGTIYIGFRYTAETSAKSMTFCIDNVIVGESTGGNDNPGGSETPDTPTPSGNTADFNTLNGGKASSSYISSTSTAGWTITNCALLRGTTGSDANPNFSFLGDDTVFAPCLNGKVGASGIVTSPTIAGGIKTLTFNYGFAYSDTKCKFTVNIKQNGSVVQSKTEEITSITKMAVYSFAMDVNVSGDFVIEIVNDCLSQATGNKDRVAIWNLSWTN